MSAVVRIEREHRARLRRERLCQAGWLTTEQAAELLHIDERELHTVKYKAIEHKPIYVTAASGKGGGLCWLRSDLEQLISIKRRCRLGWADSLRVLSALREGPL